MLNLSGLNDLKWDLFGVWAPLRPGMLDDSFVEKEDMFDILLLICL